MNNNPNQIEQLLKKLDLLMKRQDDFSKEIESLRAEILQLKTLESGRDSQKEAASIVPPLDEPLPMGEKSSENAEKTAQSEPDAQNLQKQAVSHAKEIVAGNLMGQEETGTLPNHGQEKQDIQKEKIPHVEGQPEKNRTLEQFIGENLINKIGIVIVVLGVALGTKYSIEHDLISPLTRIILGYLAGLGLLGIAIKLKKKYESYSAVLISGAMAIMYFITYFAYDFYALVSQGMAFTLMVVFTAFTVVAAINYNKSVIAQIGLVGAYAVPFLLGGNPEKVVFYFTYTTIINIGILVVAFQKYWKPLYYSSFGLTWLAYVLWFATAYQVERHFGAAMVFLFIFFVTFYLMFLGYKLHQKEKLGIIDVVLLLSNSFIFFGLGYAIFDGQETARQFLGLFSLCNAMLHFVVGWVVYRMKTADRNLFYLALGLVLVFVSIAIPIQLDGSWVTLLWTGEAALLFWIGRTQKVGFYEKLSYPLMALAFFSIVQDWIMIYSFYTPEVPGSQLAPIWNISFLTSVLFIALFSFINIINKRYDRATSKEAFSKIAFIMVPAILLIVVYFTFLLEIINHWRQLYSEATLAYQPDNYASAVCNPLVHLKMLKRIWLIDYSLAFVAALTFFNLKKLKNRQLGIVTIYLTLVALVLFLTLGLYELSDLRDSITEQIAAQCPETRNPQLPIRYISLALAVMLLGIGYRHARYAGFEYKLNVLPDIVLHVAIVGFACSELINWENIFGSENPYGLGITLLLGIYSLFLVVLGIWKKKKHIRISAVALFGIALYKLFSNDITTLSTIEKTIIFVLLGTLLLIISFLYNKYKHLISNEPDDSKE